MIEDHKHPGFPGTNALLVVATAIAIVCVLPFTMSFSLAESIFAIENPLSAEKMPEYLTSGEFDLGEKLTIIEGNSLLTVNNSTLLISESIKKVDVVVTGYSSTVEETDDTPFITASNTVVRKGIVAANFLPFGTKIRIPELYGEIIFVVEDRMNVRNKQNVDIWFPSRPEAKEFGIKKTYIEILEN